MEKINTQKSKRIYINYTYLLRKIDSKLILSDPIATNNTLQNFLKYYLIRMIDSNLSVYHDVSALIANSEIFWFEFMCGHVLLHG
jgi:hypothetical protein